MKRFVAPSTSRSEAHDPAKSTKAEPEVEKAEDRDLDRSWYDMEEEGFGMNVALFSDHDYKAEEAMLQVGGGLGHVGHHDHPLSLVVGKRLHGGGHQDDLGLQYHHHR